jgi:hypothetical protein
MILPRDLLLDSVVMHHRLLILLPFSALVSCSAAISHAGRDPGKLVGQPRSAILAEFGTPRPPFRTPSAGQPEDRFPVTGFWRQSKETGQLVESFKQSAGLFEVIGLPVSVMMKTSSLTGGQTLRVQYDSRAIVTSASVSTNL